MSARIALDEAIGQVAELTGRLKDARIFAQRYTEAERLVQALESARDAAVDTMLLAQSVLLGAEPDGSSPPGLSVVPPVKP